MADRLALKQDPEELIEKYKFELMRVTRIWANEHKNLDVKDEAALAAALLLLSASLSNVSRKWIRRFYKLGRNRKMGIVDDINVASEMQKNESYIAGSLIPYIRGELISGQMEIPIPELIEERSQAWQSRAGLYAGAAWASRWLGMGETIKEETPYGDKSQRVRRVLDRGAAHCDTCPPKAREYESWDDMLIFCRGLPADSSDTCKSNCRCSIEVEDSPGVWRRVI